MSSTIDLLKKIIGVYVLCLCPVILNADSFYHPNVETASSSDGRFLLKYSLEKYKTRIILYELNGDYEYRKISELIKPGREFPKSIFVGRDGSFVDVGRWYDGDGSNEINVYSVMAKSIFSYSVSDLYDDKELMKIPKSMSALHWYCKIIGDISRNDRYVEIVDFFSGVVKIDLKTGLISRDKDRGVSCPTFSAKRKQ